MKYDELEKLVENTINEQKKSRMNFGNIAEAILAAAIASRFIEGGQDTDVKRVYRILSRIYSEGEYENLDKRAAYEITFDVDRSVADCPAPKKAVNDDVVLRIALDKIDLNNVFNNLETGLLDGLVRACVKYVNTKTPKLAKSLECNGKYDIIEVIADGVSGQAETKTDVIVKVNGRVQRSDFGKISLKAGSGTLGQAGTSWKKESEDAKDGVYDLFFRLFGVQLSPRLETTYSEAYQNFKGTPPLDPEAREILGRAVNTVYKDGLMKIMRNANRRQGAKNDERFIASLARGIRYAAALEEKGVYVVDLNRITGDFSEINFDNIEEVFEKFSADIKIKMDEWSSPGSWPRIRVVYEPLTGNSVDIAQLRVKVEDRPGTKRLAHYIEGKPGIKQLAVLSRQTPEEANEGLTNSRDSYNILADTIEEVMSEE